PGPPGADARPARGAGSGARRPGRRARSDQQGAGRAAPGGGRAHQPADRRGAVHLAEDGQRPCVEHPRQAGRLRPRRGGGGGPPPRPVPGRFSRRIRKSRRRATIGVGHSGPGPGRPAKGERCSTPSRNCSPPGASTPRTSRIAWR
ncbi:LuxR family transcriptional regulator, partial [Streptomyces variabilis]